VIDGRLQRAQQLGATRTVNVLHESLDDVKTELRMSEGFDVGLEMSGNASAFNQMLDQLCHGGKVAMLGIPPDEMAIDWNTVIFNMLTLKGVYGREMYETWYKMSVFIEMGLDISPVITHRLHYSEYEKGFAAMNDGVASKVILNWSE
jgi:threonine 3-dehydrogenase